MSQTSKSIDFEPIPIRQHAWPGLISLNLVMNVSSWHDLWHNEGQYIHIYCELDSFHKPNALYRPSIKASVVRATSYYARASTRSTIDSKNVCKQFCIACLSPFSDKQRPFCNFICSFAAFWGANIRRFRWSGGTKMSSKFAQGI